MQNLINSLLENFSNQHIFNLGQYDSFSRLDSFGDIPGHEIILFLDLRILWALSPSSFCSSEWVLLVVIGSYVDFPGQRCQWVQNKLLSVIFPDSLIPSVLGTSKVVTVSYNFPTGEHQFDTLIKNFMMQVEKTNKWLSDCFRPFRRSFQLEVFWTWLYAFTVQTMVFKFLLSFAQQFISHFSTKFQRSVQVSNQCYKPVTFLDLVIFPVILSNFNFYFSLPF